MARQVQFRGEIETYHSSVLAEEQGAAIMGSRRRKPIRGLGLSAALAGLVFCATLSTQAAERFVIRVERQAPGVDIEGAPIVKGRLIINGQDLGETVENPSYKLEPGTFEGAIRYVFQRDLLLSSGVQATIGDLVVALDHPHQGSAKQVDILFRSGNLSSQSRGSILLGSAFRGSAGDLLLPPNHPLNKMRMVLYGSATPVIYPDKPATITIAEDSPLTAAPSAPKGLQVRVR
jgi:hypothetical protein